MSTTLPRISIVIPNYNSGALIERAILSLLAQDYPNLQIIVADSQSTDASRDMIEKYRHVFDTVVIKKDRNNADGLNNGFVHAKGDIFGWLCADDELLPGALHHIVKIFQDHPEADMVIGGCQRIFADGSTLIVPPQSDTMAKITVQCCIEQPSTFWRAALHHKVEKLDISYNLACDWDLWCRMRLTGPRVVTTDQLLSRYYFSATNKSGSSGSRLMNEMFRVVRQYGPLHGALAYIFRFLYNHFDLHGCFDKPRTCSRLRLIMFIFSVGCLRLLIGKRLLYLYNWHFASCQERGLKWWS